MAKEKQTLRKSTSEVINSMFKIKPDKKDNLSSSSAKSKGFYTLANNSSNKDGEGNYVTKEDSVNCYAKLLKRDKEEKYYIKSDGRGLYDPTNIYNAGVHTRKRELKFIEVSKLVFTLYLSFLRTRNRTQFMQAEQNLKR